MKIFLVKIVILMLNANNLFVASSEMSDMPDNTHWVKI